MGGIEEAFTDTAKIVLGTGLKGLESYGDWLSRRIPLPYMVRSAKTGKDVWMQPPESFLNKRFDPERVVDMSEADLVNKSPFSAGDLEGLDLRKALSIVKPVAYYCGNLRYGNCLNAAKSSSLGDCRNVYFSEDTCFEVQNVAYSNAVLFSQNMFGCRSANYSGFCLKTFNSVWINRGFEIDGCSKCSDVYFCHNSENLRNCILCFNAKSLDYAVGNTVVGEEKFLEVKDLLLGYVAGELKKKKKLDVDIFNVGCRKGR
ncbi:Uncharacterised protein [uncultured archaeon]|nr:Uncharacterised protein [uncultured archaeon]